MKRLLFVCYGNIVRSPLAESLFRDLTAKSGLDDKYLVDSAGTSGLYDGAPPDSRMRRAAASHGVELAGHSRQFLPEDFDRFDLILAMDKWNAADVLDLSRSPSDRAKVRLLRDFDPEAGPASSVPDPIASGPEAFEQTYAIVERSVQGLLEALESGRV